MEVKFSAITQPAIEIDGEPLSPEAFLIRCARVSSPNPDNPNYAGLLKFCIRERHWSVFEPVSMTLEITTTRAIAPQILRHRSFSFLEFSLRYAKAIGYEAYDARSQDDKNRQNSIDNLDNATKQWFLDAQEPIWDYNYRAYQHAIEKGIAKECARSLLPLNTVTRLYMTGSVRNWIHYFQVRCGLDTQLEHREIALAGRAIFVEKFPVTAQALDWA